MNRFVFSYLKLKRKAGINIASAGILLVVFAQFSNSMDILNPFFFQQELLLLISLPLVLIISAIIFFPNSEKFHLNRIDLAIIAFTTYLTFHILFTKPVLLTSNHYLVFPTLLILYFLLKNIYYQTHYPKLKKHFVPVISVFVLIPVLIVTLEMTSVLPKFNSFSVFTGGLLNQGALAVYIASMLPFFVAIIFLGRKGERLPIYLWLVVVFSILILVISSSRSAWLGSVIAISYILLQRPRISFFLKNTFQKVSNKIILGVFTVSFTIILGYLLYSFKKDSANGRLFIWKTCFSLIQEKPAFGYGFDQFVSSFNQAQIAYFKQNPNDTRNGWLVRDGSFAFNDYLQITVELGIVGLILFIFLLTVLIRDHTEHKSKSDPLLVGSRACILSLAVCGMFSYPFFVSQILFFFFKVAAYISSKSKADKSIQIHQYLKSSVLIIAVFLLSSSWLRKISEYKASIKWKEAHLCSERGDVRKAAVLYDDIYPVLKNQALFLFNYGSQPSSGEKSIPLLEAAVATQSSYDGWLNLAMAFEAVDNFKEAEKYYLYCSNLIPHRFLPKYRLFQIYKKLNNKDKASQMADVIAGMDIKVYSELVGNIKNEAFQYLRNQ